MSVNLNKLCALNGVACIPLIVVAKCNSLGSYFHILISQRVCRMAVVFFPKVSVINKCLVIFEMFLMSSSVLYPRIFSASEVIYACEWNVFCCEQTQTLFCLILSDLLIFHLCGDSNVNLKSAHRHWVASVFRKFFTGSLVATIILIYKHRPLSMLTYAYVSTIDFGHCIVALCSSAIAFTFNNISTNQSVLCMWCSWVRVKT